MKYMLFLYESNTLTPMGTYPYEKEAIGRIMQYLDSIGFKSYYQRYYKKNPKICDFGSHTTFFHIYEVE